MVKDPTTLYTLCDITVQSRRKIWSLSHAPIDCWYSGIPDCLPRSHYGKLYASQFLSAGYVLSYFTIQ